MQKIKEWNRAFWLFILTGKTDRGICKLFNQLCQLDFRDQITVGQYQVLAGGGSIEIRDGRSTFAINAVDCGIAVYQAVPLKDNPEGWVQVYRSKKIIAHLQWFYQMKEVCQLLGKNFFRQRQIELSMQQGIM